MNGVFTEKQDLSFSEMFEYLQDVVRTVFTKARVGIAFNVMSKHVDWERPDLFHVPFDVLRSFLVKNVSRHFVFRQDYGLFEYTTYVYRSRMVLPDLRQDFDAYLRGDDEALRCVRSLGSRRPTILSVAESGNRPAWIGSITAYTNPESINTSMMKKKRGLLLRESGFRSFHIIVSRGVDIANRSPYFIVSRGYRLGAVGRTLVTLRADQV